jgi:hypothetical protein
MSLSSSLAAPVSVGSGDWIYLGKQAAIHYNAGMRTKRVIQRRQRGGLNPACGCIGILIGTVIVLGVALIVLLPALPGLALQFAGFNRRGETAAVFQNSAPPAAPIAGAVQPVGVTVSAGRFGQFDLPAGAGYQVTVGPAQSSVTLTEQAMLDQCRLRSALCGAGDGQFRNARFDFRPSGAVIYVDAWLSTFNLWQTVGLVVQLDDSRRQLVVTGVDVGGALYDVPASGLGGEIDRVVGTVNDALDQVTVTISGGRYLLQSIWLDEQALTLVLGQM